MIPLAFAVLFTVFAARHFALTYSSGEWKNPSDEMVTKWEDHVRALREALPRDVNQAGYVDDSIVSGNPKSLDGNEFQLMQYSVAPVALEIGIGQEWIIGNFADDVDFRSWLDEQIGAHEVQGFGFGLYLIHDLED
ncbi:MAG: hypothetical protein DPW18_10290 [Chloroflexi bacterium]|nr:hypothetical protein [Chloroflexota bacterium]